MLNKIRVYLKYVFRAISKELPNYKTYATVLSVIFVLSIVGATTPLTICWEKINLSKQVVGEDSYQKVIANFDVYQDVEETQRIEYKASQICFIGDSRIVHLGQSVESDATFISKSSTGLSWFKKSALPQYEKKKSTFEIVIVALGINDLKKVDEYVGVLNEFSKDGEKIYVFLNVGPVDEEKTKRISNESVEQFNNTILSGLNANWMVLNQYQFLMSNGFESKDGIHYSKDTSKRVFDWIMSSVQKQEVAVISSRSVWEAGI